MTLLEKYQLFQKYLEKNDNQIDIEAIEDNINLNGEKAYEELKEELGFDIRELEKCSEIWKEMGLMKTAIEFVDFKPMRRVALVRYEPMI
jgi:hypothetical protein